MTEEERKRQNQYAVNGDAVYGRLTSNAQSGYSSPYDEQISDLYKRISSRPGFSYDVTKDPIYKQYRDQYMAQGKLAMQDTMGQAAALTGGYGSSYGQQVGQQAYNAYLDKLNGIVPDLYSSAYSRWAGEGDRLLQQYSLLQQQRDTDYNRWYNDQQMQYSKEQQAYSQLYQLIGTTGYVPTDDELSKAGMTRKQADALREQWKRQNPNEGGSSGDDGNQEPKTPPPAENKPLSDSEVQSYVSRARYYLNSIPSTEAANQYIMSMLAKLPTNQRDQVTAAIIAAGLWPKP